MQKVNVNTPITITGRHVEVTDAIREFVTKKIEGIRLDFPRIMEVKVLLDVQRDRMISQVILFCSDHITIDASTEGADMYACIDETITKIMRRMRKHKTRLMKKFRPHHQETIRKLDETVYDDSVLDHPEDSKEDPEPMLIHRESYNLKKLYKEEAIMELELSDKPFVLYRNARRDVLQRALGARSQRAGVLVLHAIRPRDNFLHHAHRHDLLVADVGVHQCHGLLRVVGIFSGEQPVVENVSLFRRIERVDPAIFALNLLRGQEG